MITVTQMEYILAVAKEENFRRAALACNITQPTLSVQIQKFEEYLNVTIFDRSKSPVKLTKIGEGIIEQVQAAYTETLKIVEFVKETAGDLRGELRVGVIPTISPYLVPLFLKDLNLSYPDLELSLSELTTDDCLKALDREDIDVAILATSEDRKKYQQEKLFEEEMFLFTNSSHDFFKRKQISIDELSAKEIWLLEEGHCLRDEVIKACHLSRSLKNKPRNLNLKIGSLESIRYLVEENFGYTILPYLSTLKLSKFEKSLLRPFTNPKPRRTINLTKRRRFLKAAAITALKEKIIKNLPQGHEIIKL